MRNTLVSKLIEFAKKDKDVILLVGDLGFGCFEPFAKEFPTRFVNCGIAEQNMMSVAAGMAKLNKKVFVYSIATFSTLRCIEQIRNDVAYHDLPITIITVGAGLEYSSMGMSHHATEDLSVVRALPNVAIYSPANVQSCAQCLDQIYKNGKPAYIRLNKSGCDSIYDKCNSIDIDKVLDGKDIAILSMGTILDQAYQAGKIIGASVYSISKIKPLNQKAIAKELSKYKKVITLEEHNKTGGFGSAVCELVCDNNINVQVKRFAIEDIYTHQVGKRDYLRKFYGIDKDAIIDYCKK